ncbi:MAG TPA: MFS transporter, partial [Bacilli bacterium]|nr:MFS transporter [Bacilli bacterium]
YATTIDVVYIPLIYAVVMGIDALAALAFGILYDKRGTLSLVISTIFSVFITPLFFYVGGIVGIIGGLCLWGIAMGAQESVLKAVITSLISKEKRATAYGIFYAVFGGAWFIGSLIVGALYEINTLYVVLFSSSMEILAVLLLIVYGRKKQQLERETLSLPVKVE